jgi:hypothetical protein
MEKAKHVSVFVNCKGFSKLTGSVTTEHSSTKMRGTQLPYSQENNINDVMHAGHQGSKLI